MSDVSIVTCTIQASHLFFSSIAPAVSASVSRSGSRTEGDQYTLTCTVSGHQSLMATVTYQWSRGSTILNSQTSSRYTFTANRLIFNPVDREDSGTYTCRATVRSSLLNSNITPQGSTSFTVTGIILFTILFPTLHKFTISMFSPSTRTTRHFSLPNEDLDLSLSPGLNHHLEAVSTATPYYSTVLQ